MSESRTSSPSECQILVVDDNEQIRVAVADILEDEGYPVAHAEDGLDALEKLRTGLCPRLILLDLMMPHMDGATFRRHQAQDPSLANIPVVVVSADWRIHQVARDLGVAGALPKPFSAKALLDVVHEICP